MAELERVYEGEVVEEQAPSWEQLISEWAEGARLEFAGQLRQARAAASVVRHYGRASMKHFAAEVGCSKSWAYDLARVWWVYGHLFEDGDFSNRLETRGISHYLKALRAPDPVAMIEEAEDEDLSARQIEERIREREEAESGAHEKPKTRPCEACGGTGEVPVD